MYASHYVIQAKPLRILRFHRMQLMYGTLGEFGYFLPSIPFGSGERLPRIARLPVEDEVFA